MDNRLYERRKELGLTLEDVGNIVGVTKSTVKKWESGYIENMKRDKIALLAKALKVSPLYIMGIDAGPDEVNDENYINLQLESNTVEPEPDYYLNDETRKIAKEVYENPELRTFFRNPGRKLMDNYGQLSDTNKKKVVNYSDNLLAIQRMEEEQLHLIPDAQPTTIAAHFDGDKYTEDEMREINQFAEFAKNKKK